MRIATEVARSRRRHPPAAHTSTQMTNYRCPRRRGTPCTTPRSPWACTRSQARTRTLDSLDGVRHAKLLRRSVVSASQIARVQARNDELREMFDLPKQGSQLLEDYNCALQKKILLQGRMFVFEEYVCFHANIFGYVKTKVMPLNEVTSVRRCKHVGFPNSIEFYFRGRREFFTSFLSPDFFPAGSIRSLAWKI